MNHRQQVAAMHARELANAKQQLLLKVNQYIQEVRAEGGTAEVTPQIQRLIELDKYRLRDVQRMRKIASDPKNVQEYVYAENAQGQVISGEKAIKRYQSYQHSGIARPADQFKKSVETVIDTVKDMFVDMNAYNEFARKLNALVNQDINEPTEEEWFVTHGAYLARLKNPKEIEASKKWFMYLNRENTRDMERAFNTLLEQEGAKEVARRINENLTKIMEAAVIAAIGYKEQAGSAVQDVLIILAPRATREQMQSMQELYDSQFEYNDYEE